MVGTRKLYTKHLIDSTCFECPTKRHITLGYWIENTPNSTFHLNMEYLIAHTTSAQLHHI